jgi:hypothetical protein
VRDGKTIEVEEESPRAIFASESPPKRKTDETFSLTPSSSDNEEGEERERSEEERERETSLLFRSFFC